MTGRFEPMMIPDAYPLGYGNDTPQQAKWRRYCESGQRDADAAALEAERERRGRFGPEIPFPSISAASARQYGHHPGAPGLAKSDAEWRKVMLEEAAMDSIPGPMCPRLAIRDPATEAAAAEEQRVRLESVMRARQTAQEAAAASNARRREARERDKERRRQKRNNEQARKRNK
jgi:hypothetical protein